jgi:hypothetical protein
MPTLTPVDETFFDTAPERYTRSWSIDRPAEQVWSELTGEHPLHWCRGLATTWTSARPLGVGSTRVARVLGGVLVAQEHFFLWDEGKRYAFYATAANVPVFASLAEDYAVIASGPAACQLTWTVAIAPTALGKPGKPLNGFLFKRFFNDTARYFNAD